MPSTLSTELLREIEREQRELKVRLRSYIAGSRLLVTLTAPVLYIGVIPFALLDLFVTVYQAVCFPVYGIPKVKRGRYVVFDRGKLAYLNALEKMNCVYCSYANGLCAYAAEVAARTEQHWCPIKHARPATAPHSRYDRFVDYGDAQGYRARVEQVRRDYRDIE